MSTTKSSDFSALPYPQIDRLDQICDRFEAACQAGSLPDLEEYLAEVAETERLALFRELLAIHLEYRLQLGEQAKLEDYTSQFPEYSDLILKLACTPSTSPFCVVGLNNVGVFPILGAPGGNGVIPSGRTGAAIE